MKRNTILWQALAGALILIGAAAVRLARPAGGDLAPSLLDRGVITRWPWIGAALGWIVFSLYWEAAAKKTAETKSAESRVSRGIHVFLTNAALILVIAPVRGVAHLLPLSTAIMAGGLAIEAMGLYLAILARRRLGRYWSGEISIKVDHRLIRSGPYQKLRHPIYTGLLAMYAGAAVVTGTWLALAGFAMALFAYARKIRLEEANLRVAFGAEYEAYRRESWALAPGLF
jgi:protein-S-isoprenylcysteine O-methyltransferase Ste14